MFLFSGVGSGLFVFDVCVCVLFFGVGGWGGVYVSYELVLNVIL